MAVETPNSPMKSNQFVLIHEFGELPNDRYTLTDDGGQRRSANTHIETEDEASANKIDFQIKDFIVSGPADGFAA